MKKMNTLAIIIIVLIFFLLILSLSLIIYAYYTTRTNHNTLIVKNVINDNLTGLYENSYQIEFYNSSSQTLLLGALGPTPVMPREGTWEMLPNSSLHINIPNSWLNTAGNTSLNGPRFWARTGCRYNIQDDKAQCETGSCGGGAYDCSKNNFAGQIPASLAEFCFQCGNGLTYYDVSLVDGYNLSINIEPLDNPPATNPNDPNDVFWCKSNTCNSGQDLRSLCPEGFQLHNSDLNSYIPGQPNNIIGCFSNCGRYEYPTAPLENCNDETDEKCRNWRQYCCQGPDYGHPCNSDADCKNGGACWTGNDRPISLNNPGTCQCRAYYRNPSCPNNICTNPQGAPPPGMCVDCIGDDVIHQVCNRAYSWANDPQTYNCSSKRYRITFSPGGTPVPVTPSVPSIPKCSQLPSDKFDYASASRNCANIKSKYMCAVQGSNNWACNVDGSKVGCDGVLCERDTAPPNPPPSTIPYCNTLPSQYNPTKGIQDCSIPNQTNKYNCAVTNAAWACGVNPQNYTCSGTVCDSS
jgi:hypothetical protein